MKKIKQMAAFFCAISLALSGCAATGEQPVASAVSEASLASASSDKISAADVHISLENVTVITQVFGDGQKPSAVALQYSSPVDPASVTSDDFQVEDQTITKAYTNKEAAISAEGADGNFIILEFAYENSSNSGTLTGGGTGGGTGGPGGPPSGDAGGMDPGGADNDEQDSEPVSVSVKQIGEIASTDGSILKASDTSVSSNTETDLIVQDFQQLEYTDPQTGYTIPYNLYLPADYDASKTYPLVFFVADSSANNNVITTPLTQGNGATVWATPEEQAKHECIVLAPQYTTTLVNTIGMLTEDDHQWSEGLTLVSNLLFSVIDEYSVDKNRIYGTGQSQGCMTNIAISDKYPDLFAAQYLVAGQWDAQEMSAMKDKNLWITVCEGDTKAYPGMNEATANWETLETKIATSEMWDSTSTPKEFDALVAATEALGCKINYTVFEGGNHMYTWTVAYNIEGIRDWLFAQSKNM